MSQSRFAERLERIEEEGGLVRVEAPVDPCAPLQTISDETRGVKAALLSNLMDRRFPMVGQLMTDSQRICRLMGLDSLDQLAEHFSLTEVAPTVVKRPACQQVVRLADDLDATILPSLCLDEEPLAVQAEIEAEQKSLQKITAATLLTLVEAEAEKKVSGIFCRNGPEGALHKRFLTPFSHQLAAGVDLVVESPMRLVPCWRPQDQLEEVRTYFAEQGQPMPVAILLGGDPWIRVMAEAPTPWPIDPTLLGTSLEKSKFRKQKVEVTPCRTLPELTIPADTDMVIEGQWNAVEDVIEVQAVTHRINPVLPFAMPAERATVRRALLKGLIPWWRAELQGLADLTIPRWADDGTVLVGSVEKAYANKAQQIADSLAEHPTWHDVRLILLLDETVDLSDESAILAALAQNAAFAQKTLIAVAHTL